MNEHLRIIFAPLLPVSLLEALAIIAVLLVAYALWRRARGSFWRGIALALLLLALADPSLVEEQRAPLKDTALLVIDDSASMQIDDRPQQTAKITDEIAKKLADFSDLDVQTLHVKGTSETDLFRAIEGKLSALPPDRFAGAILITDGEVHDQCVTSLKVDSACDKQLSPSEVTHKPENPASLPGPIHVLLAGHQNEIDRRLAVTQAPAYGIVGKSVTLTLRLDDHPKAQGETAPVTFLRDNGENQTFNMPIGEDVKFDVPITHAGRNLFAFSATALPHELTAINNSAALTINGIRDRLRVLLVSGEPHIGGRTWRNFLKADPAVDLIHFTILRSPTKMDGIPNSELSLIAFPVNELFEVKLKSFDLVIFDRFRQQSLIPDQYLENIAHYVEQGGALLISNATDAGMPPLTFSPLARILPAEPTGHLLTGAFVPDLTDAGQRHPVTNALVNDMPRNRWGPWFRQIEAQAKKGDVLLSGLNGAPLLVLAHAGQGRVAQFLSDQFWLWSRGYEGGGPQADLLKRTAHWLVGEPELDETALRAHAELGDSGGWQLVITKQSLHDESASVTVTDPDDQTSQATLAPDKQPGILKAVTALSKTGLYHLKSGDEEILVMAGPENAPEFGDMFATDEKLKPYADASGGGIFWLEDHPDGIDIRRTGAGSTQTGWNWIGLKKNDQYRITGSKAYPLWPAWLAVIVLLGAAMLAWRREGKG